VLIPPAVRYDPRYDIIAQYRRKSKVIHRLASTYSFLPA
jgi:hypothetical protein